jgi:hypothetical protein
VSDSETRKERLGSWLAEQRAEAPEGPEITEQQAVQHDHPWWKVMCLTGVDYYSTLGYLPAIAIASAGAVAPIAVLFIVALTLAGMVPVYRRIANESPHGQGSIAMLERLLTFWKGKLFVLMLLGFVATAWFVTITLSAADATAHIVENPLVPHAFDHPVTLTVALLLALGVVFMKGFKEAIGLAMALVVVYLALNLVIVVEALWYIVGHPSVVDSWTHAMSVDHGSFSSILLASFVAVPALALGLSGFETGVGMMPLIHGEGDDPETALANRIRHARTLLLVAALIMTVYLVSTTFVTTVLIPDSEFDEGGAAVGRALAFLAHERLGEVFGTIYDLSTVGILWFAGASAMAGLLNVVPRYLPRYGMAPEWTRMIRPLVLLNTAVAIGVTILFDADVEAQAGAYATGVLAMMLSAAFAVLVFAMRHRMRAMRWIAGTTTVVIGYALIVNLVNAPSGIAITLAFIAGIVVASFASRIWRSTELRTSRVEFDELAHELISTADTDRNGQLMFVAHRPRTGAGLAGYRRKENEQRSIHSLQTRESVLFLEIEVEDASEFDPVLYVSGHRIGPLKVLRGRSSTVPNAIAAFLLHVQDEYHVRPDCYFGWTEGNPFAYMLRYVLFGEGDTAPVTREVLRQAVDDPTLRPPIHVGG